MRAGAQTDTGLTRRGSILYPMLMHSLSNVIVIGGGYLYYAFG